jgi:hypothetical protein
MTIVLYTLLFVLLLPVAMFIGVFIAATLWMLLDAYANKKLWWEKK